MKTLVRIILLTLGYYIIYNGLLFLFYGILLGDKEDVLLTHWGPVLTYLLLFLLFIFLNRKKKFLFFTKLHKNAFLIPILSILLRIAEDPIIRIKSILFELKEIGNINWEFYASKEILIFISAVILSPIVEELFFRGLLFKICKKNYSRNYTILLTSILFGLIHFNPFDIESTILIATLNVGVGAILGVLYFQSNNILIPIIFHSSSNLIWFALRYWSSEYFKVLEYLNYGFFYWSIIVAGGVAFYLIFTRIFR